MKAIIEERKGLYIIRIKGNDGALYDLYVVEEIEIKEQGDHREDLRFAIENYYPMFI